ncbi:hypothetical protein ACN6KF_003044 [Labrys sp. La1]|uniref:hypothetical protein n=1 Tax=Labrys sp. La1 TaxID=3404917 RepID=UPI003EB7A0F0
MAKLVTKSVVRRRMDWQRLQEATRRMKEAERRLEEAEARQRRAITVHKIMSEAQCASAPTED